MTIKTRKPTAPVAKETKTLSRARKPDAAKVSKAKSQAIEEVQGATAQAAMPPENMEDHPITGRGVFAVRTVGNAVSVEAAFLAEDGNVLRFPAVFPNREYALAQVEDLRQLINRHFDELLRSGGN